MSRRKRIDSTTAEVAVMQAALQPIKPPPHVRMDETDWPFWESVVAEFAHFEWTDHQLEVAAILARTMADLEREQWELRQEGSVSHSEKGTPVVNPRKAVVQMLAGAILSLRRSLALNARAQAGEMRDIANRRAKAKEIEEDNPLAQDDLLARPSLN
jgi:hypothetical protein